MSIDISKLKETTYVFNRNIDIKEQKSKYWKLVSMLQWREKDPNLTLDIVSEMKRSQIIELVNFIEKKHQILVKKWHSVPEIEYRAMEAIANGKKSFKKARIDSNSLPNDKLFYEVFQIIKTFVAN